jgi:FlaA1/EpsC-like NDP-sugar epimerase
MENRMSTLTGVRSWLELLWIKRYQICVDTIVMCFAFGLAHWLTFGFQTPMHAHWGRELGWMLLVQWVVIQFWGIHRVLWRYISLGEVALFVKAAICWAPLGALIIVGTKRADEPWLVQAFVILLNVLFAFAGLLGVRVLWKLMCHINDGESASSLLKHQRKRVVLIGAGEAGERALSEILHQGAREFDVRGFVDDDRRKRQSMIHGVPVLGAVSDLPTIVRELQIDHVIISMAQCPRDNFRRILTICGQIPVRVRTIPSLNEILQDNAKVSRIRDMGIADLLGREPVQLMDEHTRALINGKCVMVTGAGGSIGSELVRRTAHYKPETLLLVERSEFALFTIDNEMRAAWPELNFIPVLADVTNQSRIAQVFKQHGPQIVLHAAAHKHVPLIENNVTEAITNNVIATQIVGEQAAEHGAEVFVLISSDKAVRPKSVMGASKRVSELIVQEFNRRYRTQFLAVRFGNVIGSAGSVVPNFEEQIRKGGPVTVTHPEMQRYFMTIPEAAELVLEAAAMGQGGEIFVLDMGEPVRVVDLAKEMILLSGLRPFKDIDIVYTGIRPGEKLFEELSFKSECMSKTRHPKIFIGQMGDPPGDKIFRIIDQLIQLSGQGNEADIKRVLSELIPDAQFEQTKPPAPMISGTYRPRRIAGGATS